MARRVRTASRASLTPSWVQLKSLARRGGLGNGDAVFIVVLPRQRVSARAGAFAFRPVGVGGSDGFDGVFFQSLHAGGKIKADAFSNLDEWNDPFGLEVLNGSGRDADAFGKFRHGE